LAPILRTSKIGNGSFLQSDIQHTLLREAQEGNLTAQRKLFEQYFGYVKSLTLRYMATVEEAEEMLNDVFLKFFDRLDQYNPSFPLKSWIRRITINTCIDRLRSLKKLPRLMDLDSLTEPSSAEDDFSLDGVDELLPLLQSLPPRYRLVFNLYVFEDYKHREIADMLNISEGTSKSNYARAKQILKRSLMKKARINQNGKIHLVFKSQTIS